MRLQRLTLTNVRCFQQFELSPNGQHLLIEGANASGKTSILESIYFAARGRSFRTSDRRELLYRGEKTLQVFLETEYQGETNRIGVSRGKVKALRLNGESANTLSSVTRFLPIQYIGPESMDLLTGPPDQRRKLMDWGLFHVKHDTVWPLMNNYRRLLKQRNSALRSKQSTEMVRMWDPQLAEAGEALALARREHMLEIGEELEAKLGEWLGVPVKFELTSGWKDGSLAGALNEVFAKDYRNQVTSVGPHRADWGLRVDGQTVRAWASRGQVKALCTELLLRHAVMVGRYIGTAPLLLVDDLQSELSDDTVERVFASCLSSGCQLVATSLPGGAWSTHIENVIQI